MKRTGADEKSTTRRGLLPPFLKLIFAGALLAALFHWRVIELDSLSTLSDQPGVLISAILMILAAMLLGTYRWWLLLEAQDISLSFRQAFRICIIANFSSNFLPGAAGGEATRLFYIIRATRGRRTAAIVSLVADRILGLVGLLLITLVIIFAGYERILASPLLTALAAVVCLAVAAMLAAMALVILALDRFRWVAAVREWARRGRAAAVAGRGLAALAACRHKPRQLVIGLGVSALIHILTVWSILVIGVAMHAEGLSALDYALAAPLALVANAIPFTPGGIGIGEGAFDRICHLLEPTPSLLAYGSIFFLFRSLCLLVSLCGAGAFIVQRREDAAEGGDSDPMPEDLPAPR